MAGRIGPERFLSPVRRIDNVAPPESGRVVAVTFEDGPTASAPSPEPRRGRWRGNGSPWGAEMAGSAAGITATILDILDSYHALGTFVVIGSTADNYPDSPGPSQTPYWNGTAFDHFPEYGQDALAGVANQPELTKRIIAAGHELANHGYRHRPSSRPQGSRARRAFLGGVAETLAEVKDLHDFVLERYGLAMRLGRPADSAEAVRAGDQAEIYEAYARLGYNYLGWSVDGGGWRPTAGSYDNDVETMVLGLQRALEKDGQALSGHIVSERDGYNMSRESPVLSALPRIMQLFRNYGYKVVTVSALLRMSPFNDLAPGEPAFPVAKALLERGFWIAYRDNKVRPSQPLVRGELAVWAMGAEKADPSTLGERPVYADVLPGHPYRWHVETAATRGLWRGLGGKTGRPTDPDGRGSRVFGIWDPVTPAEYREVMGRAGLKVANDVPELGPSPEKAPALPPSSLTHAQALVMLEGEIGLAS